MWGMTLNELSKRLQAIVAENNERGWSERNDLPVAISIAPLPRQPRQRFKPNKYYRVKYASSAMCGKDQVKFMTIDTDESQSF